MVYTRYSRAIDSPRHLVLRHARNLLEESENLSTRGLNDPPKIPKAGDEKLYSFYAPALEAGAHTVTIDQEITTPANPETETPSYHKSLSSVQKFNVVAPRFTLPEGSVHSVYPPQGHGDNVEILPHVVLNDPHLPWERVGSKLDDPKTEEGKRNRVPWLAVLVFTQDELRLGEDVRKEIFQRTEDLKWAGGVEGAKGLKDPVQQSTTLAINMKISDLLLTDKTTTPIKEDDPTVAQATTDVIFLQRSLFSALVTTYDKDGKPAQGQENSDVSRYKYLAHVRNINTKGMAEAGVEDEGLFSIVVSHRVGPLAITKPTAVVVHLVSIEGVAPMPFDITTPYVALSSLHSWMYTCLPPNSFNIFDTFQALGNTLNVLRAPDWVIEKLGDKNDGRVAQRLRDGYSLVRYRVQTGEITVALTRGPFTPTTVPHRSDDGWKSLSHFGTDLQILDQELGLMDITYCSAWQLGKTLALADQAFATALSRIRSQIYNGAMDNAKASILRDHGAYETREETIQSLPERIARLNNLPGSNLQKNPVNRWRRGGVDTLDLSYGSPLIDPIFAGHAEGVARGIGGSPDGDGKQLYNEFNTHNSSDWIVVFKWILDRMYLVNVPAHYLITDPTHLPRESLRFFHIDPNWVDALIDGALSIANHLDRDDDKVRTSIKKVICEYLKTPDPKLGYCPQIPTYGFLLRSELCTQFPDLMIQVPAVGPGAPILRHENITDGVMLCLFDQVPSVGKIEWLTLAQPPHQQSFAAGAELNASQITTSYRRIYTTPGPHAGDIKTPLTSVIKKKGEASPIFVWGEKEEIRTLLFPAWAEELFSVLKDKMGEDFKDTVPGSALVGIQLNNPAYQLKIILGNRPELEPLTRGIQSPDGPRTLKLLEPRLKKAAKAVPEAARREAREEGPPASLPLFGQRNRSIPLEPDAPPHFRSLRAPEPRAPRSGNQADPPDIAYSVYPTNSTENVVPMEVGILQDLVFSIIVVEGGADFELDEIRFSIPMGDPTAGNYLMKDYKGPGATMLSNLRFNVLVKHVEGDVLQLRLIPRSRSGKVPVKFLKEMSFVLSLVEVNIYDNKTEAPVDVVQSYEVTDLPKSFKVYLVPPGKVIG